MENLSNGLCVVLDTIFTAKYVSVVLIGIWFFLITWFSVFLLKEEVYALRKKITFRLFYTVTYIGISLLCFVFVSLFIILFSHMALHEWYTLPSAKYHSLNAAIKLACFDDKTRALCPKTEKEVLAITPEWHRENMKYTITYQYFEETNDYSLIVREPGSKYVAIFDSRLPGTKDYGNPWLDLFDTRVRKCSDKYQIINPPPFNGPWNKVN